MLGLSPTSLYSLTFKEFINAVKGKKEEKESQERAAWERTRWQTALLLNVHTKAGHKISCKDLALFPWEEEEKKDKVNNNKGWDMFKALADR